MSGHINSVCRIASFAKIRRYLDQASAEKLVHAFISSRLDNCNSILFGLPEKELNKLQRIQNMAARVVTLTRKRDHITPVMHELHWMPIHARIVFKLLLLTYKALNGQAPHPRTSRSLFRTINLIELCVLRHFTSSKKLLVELSHMVEGSRRPRRSYGIRFLSYSGLHNLQLSSNHA